MLQYNSVDDFETNGIIIKYWKELGTMQRLGD